MTINLVSELKLIWSMDKQDSGGVIICLPDPGWGGWQGKYGSNCVTENIHIFLAPIQILTNNFEMLRTEVKQASRSMSTRESLIS